MPLRLMESDGSWRVNGDRFESAYRTNNGRRTDIITVPFGSMTIDSGFNRTRTARVTKQFGCIQLRYDGEVARERYTCRFGIEFAAFTRYNSGTGDGYVVTNAHYVNDRNGFRVEGSTQYCDNYELWSAHAHDSHITLLEMPKPEIVKQKRKSSWDDVFARPTFVTDEYDRIADQLVTEYRASVDCPPPIPVTENVAYYSADRVPTPTRFVRNGDWYVAVDEPAVPTPAPLPEPSVLTNEALNRAYAEPLNANNYYGRAR